MGTELTVTRAPANTGRVAAWIARQVELALAESDLSLSQYRLLSLLAEGSSQPSSMAHRLDVRRPSITAVVDGLVSKGFVCRAHDEADRRLVTHQITDEGKRVLADADRATESRLEAIAACLGDDAAAAQALSGMNLWGAALVSWARARTPTA